MRSSMESRKPSSALSWGVATVARYSSGRGRLVQGQSTRWLVQCIGRLADQSSTHDQALRDWAKAVEASAEERNRVLHAVWLVEVRENVSIVMRRRIRSGSTFDTITLDHLRQVEAREDALHEQGLQLAEELGAK
jgi:hypothetical protein